MRNEQEVLNDFENLGYLISIKNEGFLELTDNYNIINIDFEDKEYWKENICCYSLRFTMQEHKLLTELFKIWRWL